MTVEAVSAPPRESRVLRFAKGMALIRESWVGMLGLGIIVFWALVAIFADVLAPFPPNATGAALTLPGGPSLDGSAIHYLGTDHLGRDILSRIVHGSRQVLLYAPRSEEHTSELQSLMRISYAVFCLTKNNTT